MRSAGLPLPAPNASLFTSLPLPSVQNVSSASHSDYIYAKDLPPVTSSSSSSSSSPKSASAAQTLMLSTESHRSIPSKGSKARSPSPVLRPRFVGFPQKTQNVKEPASLASSSRPTTAPSALTTAKEESKPRIAVITPRPPTERHPFDPKKFELATCLKTPRSEMLGGKVAMSATTIRQIKHNRDQTERFERIANGWKVDCVSNTFAVDASAHYMTIDHLFDPHQHLPYNTANRKSKHSKTRATAATSSPSSLSPKARKTNLLTKCELRLDVSEPQNRLQSSVATTNSNTKVSNGFEWNSTDDVFGLSSQKKVQIMQSKKRFNSNWVDEFLNQKLK